MCISDRMYTDDVIGATGFMLGGFSGVTIASVGNAAWYMAAGLLLALFLAADLNVLQLGEESAQSLGLHLGRTRFLAILAAALLAGAAVSFAGLLGFVGLLVPHMVRRLVGNDNRWLLPACVLLGGAFVLLCAVSYTHLRRGFRSAGAAGARGTAGASAENRAAFQRRFHRRAFQQSGAVRCVAGDHRDHEELFALGSGRLQRVFRLRERRVYADRGAADRVRPAEAREPAR